MPELDEAVFAVPGVMNFQAEFSDAEGSGHLKLIVFTETGNVSLIREKVHAAVTTIPSIQDAIKVGTVRVDDIEIGPVAQPANGVIKRKIVDRRGLTLSSAADDGKMKTVARHPR